MHNRRIASHGLIRLVLVAQIIPLALFPPESFSAQTQEWWLPVLLVVMVLAADVELIARRGDKSWPWYLMSFAQGLNIISRLMMLWPHATKNVEGSSVLNVPYLALTILAMVLSAVLLWYSELPEVRLGLVRG